MVRVSVLVSIRAFHIHDEPPTHHLERLPCESVERVIAIWIQNGIAEQHCQRRAPWKTPGSNPAFVEGYR